MIQYTTGKNPTEVGVYACRIPHPYGGDLLKDEFLMWIDNRWGYLGSDQNYRGEVVGWVGPLQRKIEKPKPENPKCCKNPGWCDMPYDYCGEHVYWR